MVGASMAFFWFVRGAVFVTSLLGITATTKAEENYRQTLVRIVGFGESCSGVVIGRDTILTAAHCIRGDASKYDIVFTDGRGQVRHIPAASARSHPGFAKSRPGSTAVMADLAVVRAAKAFPPCMKPAQLASDGTGGESLVAVGVAPTNTLRVMPLSGITNLANSSVRLTSSGGLRPCRGDSGGPIFRRNGGRMEIMGIISWGEASCSGTTMATLTATHAGFVR